MFRGYDAERERLVAIKLFKLDLPPERVHQLVARFERLVAAELTHPAIAAPLATGINGVSAYLAQEFVAAESLDLAVRESGPAPPSGALRVAAQLAGALDFAAAAGVHHGALHPRDVLLSSDETRLTGFGVARALEAIGVAAPVRRPYTAPERFSGGEWDRRADVFSLAALMHELLWGRRVAGTGNQAVASLADVDGADPAALRAVFARALAQNPAERYETALAFVEALAGVFPGAMQKSSVGGHQSSVGSHQSSAGSSQPERPRLATGDRGLAAEVLRLPLDEPEADLEVRATSEGVFDGVPAFNSAAPERPAEPAFDIDEVFKTSPPQPDLDLRAAEQPRYEEIEAAPAFVCGARPSTLRQAEGSGRAIAPLAVSRSNHERAVITEPEPLTALERSRSAVWPLVLALGIGLAMGFAGGYGVGVHDRSFSAPAGREFTEGAVSEPPKPASADAGGVRLPPSREASADRRGLGGGGRPDHAANTTTPATRSNAEVRLQPDAPNIGTTNTGTGAAATTAQASEAPQSADIGRLRVRSTPAGARVSVDGRDVGVTPAAVHDLARGTHRVRVSRDGYLTQERRVVITARRPAPSITVPLARATATSGRVTGDLNVQSRPSDAKVYLDGELIGTTPLSIPSVPAGEHAVRLERDGYRRWSSSVRVVANESNRVTASLER